MNNRVNARWFIVVWWLMAASSLAQAEEAPFVFRDVASQMGLTRPLQGMMAHAAAWGDVNNDGRLDLFVGTFADRPVSDYVSGGAKGPVPNQLFLQRDGRFERSEQSQIAWRGRASGAVFADLDNDGWLDLYVANNGRLGNENLLYHNMGKGRFQVVSRGAGAGLQRPETARSTTVFDYDGDGLLDLLVLGTIGKSKTVLFRNRGGMQFEPSNAIPADAHGLGMAVGDLTGNGWPDVLIGGPNRLFVNLGDGAYREAKEARMQVDFTREDDSPSCGVAFGDYDRDGDTDVLIGSHHKAPWQKPNSIRLFRNSGSSPQRVRFQEVTQQVGIIPFPMKTPHVEMRDFNNDGWPDLYTSIVVFRDGKTHPAIFLNTGTGSSRTFQDTAFIHRPEYPRAEDLNRPGERSADFYRRLVEGRKVMYYAPGPSADYDNDGRLDLMLASWFPRSPSLLLRNETPSGNYLDVAIQGRGRINRLGIGTLVRAYRAGHAGETQALLASEELAAGYGYCSGQPAIAHLGLNNEESCDLVVTLPHGKGRMTRRGVQGNQTLTLTTPDG